MSTDRFRQRDHSASKHTSEKRVTFQTADQNFSTMGHQPRMDSLTKKSSGAEGVVNALGLRSPLTNQTMQQQTSSLSKDYANRLQKMQERLDKQIAKNVVVKDGVKVNRKKDPKDLFAKNPLQDLEQQIEQDIKKKNNKMDGKGSKDELDLIPGKDAGPQDTFSFIRSKEAVELKIRGGFDQDVSDIEQDKFKLVQRLNVLLKQLDALNEDKRTLSNKLIEQIKFVRKLQSQLGTADNGHITEVIDKDLEDQFRREKHLNIQLKEKLKECEEEKVRILEQLKYLEAQKDVVVVSKSGEHIDLGRAMMSVDDMIKYRHKITGDVEQIILDLDVLRADEDQCNRSIYQLECQIRAMVDEKALMYNQIKDLTIKFEDATALINRDTHDLHYELKRQKSMLGAKVMYNALFNSCKMQKKAIFQGLRLQLKYDDRQIGSILRFRKVCIKYRRERQLKYFNLWYRYCLRPMSVVRVNREITALSQRDAFLNQVLIRWNLKKIETETRRKHNHQKMENFFKCFRTLNSRKQRYSFSQWRRAANNITYCRQKLARFVVYRISYKMKQALFKWNTVVLHQDFHMRVQSHCVRGAVIQLKQSVFQSWVMVAKQLRKERIGLMVRTWNCLRKNRMNNKNKGQCTQLLLRQGEAMNKFYLQAALYSLHQNKEQDKFNRAKTELKDEVDTDIESLSTTVSRKSAKTTRSQNQRHMDVIVTGFGRVVYAYFKKWKDETHHYKYTMKDMFKQRVLKMYRLKLQNCFNKWNQKGTKKQKKKKFLQVETIESEKKELEAEIQKTQERIFAESVSSQNRGHKLTKKLIYNSYKKYMKSRFDQWRIQLAEFDHKGNIIEKTIIVKMQRRILKLAFQRYVEKVKKRRKDAGGDIKGEAYREIIAYNSLKRMFMGIKKYYLKHHAAKKQFQRAYLQADKRSKKSWFTVWKRQAFHELDEEMKRKQNENTALVQSKANAQGSLKTTALEQEMVLKEIDKIQTSLYRKTIAKTIAQFQRYQTYEAIMRWRQRVHEYKTYQKLIQNGLIQRLLCRAQHNAFQRWRVNQAQNFKKKRKMMIQEEIQSIQEEKEQIKNVKNNKVNVSEVKSMQMVELKEVEKYNQAKFQNVTNKITRDVNNWHYITRRKHIFNIWKEWCINKRYFAKRIAKLIAKNHHQVAFDAISNYNWELKVNEKARLRFKKMCNIFLYRRVHTCMNRWKEQCFNHVKCKHHQEQQILYHYDTNAAIDRSRKQLNIIDNQAWTVRQWQKKDVFICLFNYRCIKQNDRVQQQAVAAKFVMLQQRQAVQKWLARTKLTILSRQQTKVYRSIEDYNKKRKVYDFFKKNSGLKNKIVRIMDRACRVAFNDHKRHAWAAMLTESKQNSYKIKQGHIMAQKILDKVLRLAEYRRQKYYFNRYARYNRFQREQRLNLRSIIIRQGAAKYRKVWDTWREKLNLLGVVEENHYYGKVRQETNKLKGEVKNLKMILMDEQYLPKEIENIIEDDDEHYRGICEKTMCRWYVYGEAKERKSDLWILPWCLDKWRQYIRERKAYGHWFDYLEKRNDPNLLRKRLAFESWQTFKPRRMAALECQKYNVLFWRNLDNATTLADQGDRMEQDQATLTDLKQQRDFLVAKVVSAQRLALDRCHFSYKYAKEKAWVQFVANSVAAMRKDYNGKTLGNVEKMGNLKERCQYLEKQNIVIAEENDEFKKGVIKNQRLLVTADDLQRDLENLSSELSDKAVTIRKLLEDNTLMNKKLQELERANTMSSQRQQDE